MSGPRGENHSHDGHDYGDSGHRRDHGEDHHHDHEHGHGGGSVLGRIVSFIPFVGGHSHDHGSMRDATDRGLLGIAGSAFVLGFAHEEEFEIIALSAGSYCLELMSVYAATVIVGIVGLTLLLIAGYTHYEERAERYAEYLLLFSATVLIGMGIGFIVGVF